MSCAVIVLSWGEAALTRACFQSIEANTDLVNYDLFWVRNEAGRERAALDRVEEDLGRAPRVFENETNLGFPAGVNQALRVILDEGLWDHTCLLNNDTLVPSGWLPRLIEGMPADCTAIGPLVDRGGFQRYEETHLAHWAPASSEPWEVYDRRLPRPDPSLFMETSELAFFCTVVPTWAWRTLGLLDEGFGLGYGEDVDFCIRSRAAGFRVGVNPCVAVHHEVGGTSKLRGGARFEVTSRALRRLIEKHQL